MKKLLLLLVLSVSFNSFSQALVVNTNTYTVPELVNDVLINSPCAITSNVTWRTGTNFGSSNGIGYFTNTNANFPMQSGVVLSTGNAMNVGGPNTTHLNDGAANWEGDADLEATLLQAGIPMVSTNATVLEFDFLPLSANFSFDFIFASEEYGNFQCQFSDAFAFLLTNNNTGVTTNLAVVPNTDTPISVVTIRDFLYNSACPSANSQYFGSFNGGSAAAGSATNFNGQTVVMNASAVLVPNTPYSIKLVIADRGDYESDSAIFLSSKSFNVGQNVLGPDLTVASNTAICAGGTYVLSTGLTAPPYTFSWTRNGAPIAGATGSSINVTQPGTYGVTYINTSNVCQAFTDLINIEFYPAMSTPNPKNIYKCDTGASSYVFNLDYNTPIVAGTNPVLAVSYHATQENANANTAPLPLAYSSPAGETIYVRITNTASSCFIVKSFQLLLTPAPVAYPIADWVKCARSTTLLNAIFDLPSRNPIVLGTQSPTVYNVTYHLTQAAAENGTDALIAPNLISAGQTIYVRVVSASDPACAATTSFNLIVNALPPVDVRANVIVCENYELPPLVNGNYFTLAGGAGTMMNAGDIITETQTIHIFNQPGGAPNCSNASSFRVTIINPLTLSPGDGTYCGNYILPALEYGNYFTQPGGNGTQLAVGQSITSTQTVHIYYQALESPFCVIDINFSVTIIPKPVVTPMPGVFNCTSYTLPSLTVGNYFTGPLGTGTQLAAGTSITSSQTIFVYAESGTSPVNCTSQISFKVIIGFEQPADINQCAAYTLPALPIGNYFTGPNGSGTQINAGTAISVSQTIYIHIPDAQSAPCMNDMSFSVSISQPPVDAPDDVTSCGYYVLPALTHGNYFAGPGGTDTPMFAGDIITANKTVYVYAVLSATCSNESSFIVWITPLPAIDSRDSIDQCNSYTLTPLNAGNYFTGPGGTGTMLPAGSVITESATIYIYAESATEPVCSVENSFEIFIFSVEADAPPAVSACDSYVLPALTVGDYYTQTGGPGGGEGTMKFAGDVITETITLYIYTESGERINCSDENTLLITINKTPVIPAIANVNACNSYTLPALTIGNYFTAPNGTGTQLTAGEELTTSQTIYVYAETATTPNCTDQESFTINIFNVDEQPDVISCQSFTLPALTIGKYYTGIGGTGTQLFTGSVVNTSQTIYIYAQSPFTPACFDESSFEVTIVKVPVAFPVPVAMTRICDEDGINDGVTSFDLTTLSTTVLGGQTGAEFTIAYYATYNDANQGVNPITSTTLASVFARVNNTLAPDCYAIRTINIIVNTLPLPTPVGGVVCYDTFNNMLLEPYLLSSGLSASLHTFEWTNAAGQVVGTANSYSVQEPGIYTVVATRTSTGCSSEPVSVEVRPSEPALVSYTLTENFVNIPVVTVIAEGSGDYEYQLDSGSFQDSPIFENVSSGTHTITVRDKNKCGISTTTALIVNYPHFFTPNGDGINDTWNIKDLRQQTASKITIFDRYGKLLKQITPAGEGWDGTFGGQLLPSTDYWFVVQYVEDGIDKEFRAHFAMKR